MAYLLAGAGIMLFGIIVGFMFGVASVQSTIRKVTSNDA